FSDLERRFPIGRRPGSRFHRGSLMETANIRRVSFYWSWTGGTYSPPSHRVFHLLNTDGRFLRRDSDCEEVVPIDICLVSEFLETLRRPAAPSLVSAVRGTRGRGRADPKGTRL